LAFQSRLCISAATSLAPSSILGSDIADAFLEALEHFWKKSAAGLIRADIVS
jgi:hypothetical protein